MYEQYHNNMADQLETQGTMEPQVAPEMNAFAADEIVPSNLDAIEPKKVSDTVESEYSAAAPLKIQEDESNASKPTDKAGDFLKKSEDPASKGAATDKLQSADYYWNDPEVRSKFELKFPGQAKEKYNEYYKELEDLYFKKVADETDDLIMGDTSMGSKFRKGMPVQLDMSIKRQIGGGASFNGVAMGQRRSVRQADLDSKNLVTESGDVVKVEDSWDDVIGNPKYASKDGKLITALEYIPYQPGDIAEGGVKAVYEGERSTGEIVSIHDMKGWITSNNDLTTPGGYVIPKAIARSTINTVSSLAGGFVDLLNSTATLMDSDDDNSFIKATNDLTNKFKSYGMTTADYDQQHAMTIANATNMVADVAAQLVLAGGIGRVAGGLAKLATAESAYIKAGLTAEEAREKIMATMGGASSLATITALSLMGASGVKDEAIKGGFSEDAASGLFLAYLPAMAVANKISSVIINSESAPFIKSQMDKVARESLALTTPAALETEASRWAFAKVVANKASGALAGLSEKMSQGGVGMAAEMGWASAGEATEEVVEQLLGDALKTGANIISKYTTTGDEHPKMLGMYDAEYWEQAPSNLLMNAVGGAIGGPMGRLILRHGGTQSVPFQTGDKDKIMKLVLAGGENLKLYKESLANARDKGHLGTDKFSYKLNGDGKFTRLETLDAKEKANHLSIAEANYRLKMMQVNFYESVLGGYNGTYDKLVKDHPDLAKLMTDKSASYQNAANTYSELEEMYKEVTPEMYAAAEEVKRSWFKKKPITTAATEAAIATAKTTAKTNGEHAEITTNEVTETTNLLPEDNLAYSDEIKEYATKMGKTPEFAKRLLDKEQEMEDILTGKTVERDYIDMIVAADPKTFGILSDPSFKNVKGSVLDALTVADIERYNTQQRDHANYLVKKQEYESMVDTLKTPEDITNLAKLVDDSGNPFYISPEKREVLKATVRSIVSEGNVVDGKQEGGYSDADVRGLYDHVEQEYAVTANLESATESLKDQSIQEELEAIASTEENTVERAEAVENFVEKHAKDLYQYGRSSVLKDYMSREGKTGAYDILTSKVSDLETFKNALKTHWSNLYVEGHISYGDKLPAEIMLEEAPMVYNDSTETSETELIPASNTLKVDSIKYFETVSLLNASASESSVDKPGEFADMFMKTYSPSGDGVETNSNDVIEEFRKLHSRKSADGLFDASEEAAALQKVVQARKAQLELLFRLGDPMNQLPVQINPKTGKPSYNLKSMTIGSVLSTLRKYNAKILSPEEFKASIKDTKYSKYSKFVSGWLLDPVKFTEILTKQNPSTEETAQRVAMEKVLESLNARLVILDDIDLALDELIKLGDESQNEIQVAAKFKGSIKSYIGKGDLSLAARLTTLTNDIEDGELQKKVLSLTTKAASADSSDDKAIADLYNDFIEVARTLYNLSDDAKTDILNKLTSKDKLASNMDIVAFMNSNIDEFHTNFKQVIANVKASDRELIMPTMEQEIVAFEAFSFATVPNNRNLLKQKIASYPSYRVGENNMLFVPGAYGTGKTQVVMGYAAKASQLYLQSKFPVERGNSTMVCANNTDQINKLHEAADTYGINTLGNGESYGFTKEDLYLMFKDPTVAMKKLEKVSLIVFDEATLIERYESGTEKSLFTLLAEGINHINTERAKDPKLPMLSFIGLGDGSQGGFRAGDTSLSGNVIGSKEETGSVLNISDSQSVILKTKPLTTNFRAFVTVIDSFAKAAKEVDQYGIGKSLRSQKSKIRTHYGPIVDDETGKIGGVQIVNTRGDLYTGLATELSKQLEADPKFTVLIVDESIGSAQDLPSDLQALVEKYPGAFKIENFKEESNVKVRTILGAQGMESSYVIINLPEDGWLPQINDPDSRQSHKYNLLSMLVGRARYYAKVRIDSNIDISSAEAQTPVYSIKQSTTQFMGKWTDFRVDLLGGLGKTTVVSPVTEKLANTDIQYEEGEIVSKMASDGTFEGQYKVEAISDTGDIIVSEVGSETAELIDLGLNVHTTSNLGTILRRGESENPSNPANTISTPPEVPSEVEDEYADAYKKVSLRKGSKVTFNGKKATMLSPITLSTEEDPGTIVTIDRGTDLGKTVKVARIEDKRLGDTVKALKQEVKEKSKKAPAPKPLQDPSLTPEDALDADILLSDVKAMLKLDSFDFDQIQDYKKQLTDAINNKAYKTKESLKKAVNALNDLDNLLMQDEDDLDLTEDQIDIVTNIADETFTMEGDKTGKVEAMKELEAKGVVVGYTEIAKEFGSETYNHSLQSKLWNSQDNFWNGLASSRISDTAELEELTKQASGMTNKADMGKFSYAFVSYQYMQNKSVRDGHAIVATELSSGKRFVLSHFPTSKLEDGKFKTFVEDRTRTLTEVADRYMADTKTTNPESYELPQIPGSVLRQASAILLKRDKSSSIRGYNENKQIQLPIVMETDITKAFLSGNKVLLGSTPGTLMRSSDAIMNVMTEVSDASWSNDHLRELRDAKKALSMDALVEKFSTATKGLKINDTDTNAVKATKVFTQFGGKHLVAKFGDYSVVLVKVTPGISIPYLTTDGRVFKPFFGFTADGSPIFDEVSANDEVVYSEANAIKKSLESMTLDVKMGSAKTFDNESLNILRSNIASVLGYSLTDIDNTFSKLETVRNATRGLKNVTAKSFENVSVTLNELKALTKHETEIEDEKGYTHNNIRKDLSFSAPLVFRQDVPGKKGAKTAGKIFVLYSSNGKYDLSDPSVVMGLENKIKEFATKSKDNSIEGAVASLRDGIGVLMLDYPHSTFSELANIYQNTPKEEFNRYAIPSNSAVNKRLIAFFTDIATAIKDVNRMDANNPSMGRDRTQFERIKELRKANTDEKGNIIRVLDDSKMEGFVKDLVSKYDANDPVITHFLSIIDTMTKDANMGNYKADLLTSAITEETPDIDMTRYHAYPASNLEPGTFKLITSELSGKPVILNINKRPLVFIPKSVAKAAGHSSEFQPMKLNMESFFSLLFKNATPDVAQQTLRLLDTLMLDHSIKGTLNLGIKVPPAMTKMGKTSSWGSLSGGVDLESRLTTPVKDIRSSALAFNLDNLIQSVEDAKKEQVVAKSVASNKVADTIMAQMDTIVDNLEKDIAANENPTEAWLKQKGNQAEKATNTLKASVANNKSTSFLKAIDVKYNEVLDKIKGIINRFSTPKVVSFEDIRNGKFPRPNSEIVAKIKEDNPTLDLSIFDEVASISDQRYLKETINALRELASKVRPKKLLDKYIDPIVAAYTKNAGVIGTTDDIRNIVQAHKEGKITIPAPKLTTEQTVEALHKFTNPEVINPYNKTELLRAYVVGTEEQKSELEPYLFGKKDNLNRAEVIAYAMYDALVSYPIPLESAPMLELKATNPDLYNNLMENENVKNAIANLTFSTQTAQEWVDEFSRDIDFIVNQELDTTTKTQALNALQITLSGWQSVFPGNMYNEMEQKFKEARKAIDTVDTTGKGANLTSAILASTGFANLSEDVKAEYTKILTKVQGEVGDRLEAITQVLRGEKKYAEVSDKFSDESALIAASAYVHAGSNFEGFMDVVDALFTSMC